MRSTRESRRRSASQADQTPVVDCSIWLTQVKLMSNFIFVNRALRFDPSLVTFCKYSLQSARLSKGYLRAGVLAPNARHLVACATCLPPWEGAMPIAIDQGLRRKKSPSSNLDLLQRCSTSRAPSSSVDERCAGYKIETAGGAKRTQLRILRLPAFFNTPFRHGAQTADRRRRGSPRSLSGGYGNIDRSIIPESHFEEAIRSDLREFGKI